MTERFVMCHPGEPIPKGRPRFFNGHGVTPKRTRDAEKAIRDYAQFKMRGEGREAFTGPVKVALSFCRSTARVCDLDNLIKLAMDALNGLVFADDAQVVEIVARKGIDRTHPRTVIEIEESL